ncbi:MAG TPA: signal peptidase I [Bryobacteraceae bacterium]|nr:signal peptidase I [Bryobacteraceae bacterium]HPT28335.1 signal peptidase I [Bryobacteraceae bacterium]
MLRNFAYWARDLALSVIIALVIILFLFQPVKVEGTSMLPALADQERLFINKVVYRFGLAEVGRRDMVVFWFPGDPSKSYIKRVIGLPGDLVEIRDGQVLVNGKAIKEPYVTAGFRDRTSMPPVRVPGASYFVLGDHRNASNDSRSWGPVPAAAIYGRAAFVYWPLDRMGAVR